eukprot:1186803-Prorocentrum_minimum.AAC.4
MVGDELLIFETASERTLGFQTDFRVYKLNVASVLVFVLNAGWRGSTTNDSSTLTYPSSSIGAELS